jgi:hypothetical protein
MDYGFSGFGMLGNSIPDGGRRISLPSGVPLFFVWPPVARKKQSPSTPALMLSAGLHSSCHWREPVARVLGYIVSTLNRYGPIDHSSQSADD